MKVIATELPGVMLVEPHVYADARGYFLETWNALRCAEAGLPQTFAQDNLSYSTHGVLRGLHLQNPHGQGKLVYVLQGEVFDVAVDLRVGSPGFGRWLGITLSAGDKRQLYIPPGYAHGFCVTGEEALFVYKCTAPFHPMAEVALRWDDPAIGIRWPLRDPVLSEKDRAAPLLCAIDRARLPVYE